MDERRYRERREELLVRHRGELAALDAEWAAARSGRPVARRARQGELAAAVRTALRRMPRTFTVRDVAADPVVAPFVRYRSTVSGVLVRLAREGEVECVRPGAGPIPALYRRDP